MPTHSYYIYILTNTYNSVLYIGLTNNLERRMCEHIHELIDGFTKKYKLKKLVYFEEFPRAIEAIAREKQLKNWHHDWKLNLLKSINPTFKNLLGDAETSSA